jgi:hypothetical protein
MPPCAAATVASGSLLTAARATSTSARAQDRSVGDPSPRATAHSGPSRAKNDSTASYGEVRERAGRSAR